MKKLLLFTITVLGTNFLNAQCPSITGFSVTSPSCFGGTNGSITVNFTGGTPPYDVVWTGSISQSFTTTALSQNISNIVAGNYVVTITDNLGCNTSQPVNVSQPNLLSLITVPDPTICYGQSTQIAAAGQGGTGAYTYSWSPNPFIGGGPFMVNPNTTTTYTVALSDANGCSTSPKVITINVMPPLNAIGNSITICDGESAILTPTIVSPGSGGPYSYSWSTSANTNSITVIGSSATTNTYAVAIDDGCTIPSASITFTVHSNLCTGINEITSSSISVYPNPINDGLNIVFSESSKNTKLEIYNSIGKLVLSELLNNKNSSINTRDLCNGMYFIKIIENNKVIIIQKIVKQ